MQAFKKQAHAAFLPLPQRTPLYCQPGDHPAPLGLPRALQLSGAQLLSGLTKEQQICYSRFVFLLALELPGQEKGIIILSKSLRSEGHTHILPLVTVEDGHKDPRYVAAL